jgi:micrococcal nuclease
MLPDFSFATYTHGAAAATPDMNAKRDRQIRKALRKLMIAIALCAGLPGAALAKLEGPVVGIHDGDTLTVRVEGKRVRVRLDGVDAPELGQPYGKSARRSLSELCRGKNASVVDRGKDEEGRIVGSVRCGEVDANAEQVRRGMAWVYLRYLPLGSPLYELETNARLRRLGLWRASEPVPPWEWRQRTRNKKQ